MSKPNIDATFWNFKLIDDFTDDFPDMLAASTTPDYLSEEVLSVMVSGDYVTIGLDGFAGGYNLSTDQIIQLGKVAALVRTAQNNREAMFDRGEAVGPFPDDAYVSVPHSPFNEDARRVN